VVKNLFYAQNVSNQGLKPLNETTFFVDGDDDERLIVFEKGASGSLARYVYRTSGGDITAKKIK